MIDFHKSKFAFAKRPKDANADDTVLRISNFCILRGGQQVIDLPLSEYSSTEQLSIVKKFTDFNFDFHIQIHTPPTRHHHLKRKTKHLHF